MKFIVTSLIMVSFLNFFEIFWNILEDLFELVNLHAYIFLSIFFINFFLIKNLAKFNYNLDIFYKFYILLAKTPNFFLNFFLNNINKIYTFFVYFKYFFFMLTLKILWRGFSSKFLIIWRPLFKKLSYFGYYRANRSKWIK